MVKITLDYEDVRKEARKMASMERQLIRTGEKSPKLAAEYMVRATRVLAGNKKGIMKKNVNMFKKGKNVYEVISHRWSRQSEWKGSPNARYSFPVHLWMEGLITGSWGGIPYSAVKNKTGTVGYFSKAAGQTRYKFMRSIRRDTQRALKAKF